MTNRMETYTIMFCRGDEVASVVTNGQHAAAYTMGGVTHHETTQRAMAHLEAQGYDILMDAYYG